MKRISKRLNHLRHPDLRLNATTNYIPDAWYAQGHTFPLSVTRDWREQMKPLQTKPGRGLHIHAVNGRYDPVTIAVILDCLLLLYPDSAITSARLVELLQSKYPRILWDTTTVGMILNKICDAAADKNAEGAVNAPFFTWKVNGLSNYTHSGEIHGWRWMGRARQIMGEAAVRATAEQNLARDPEIWNLIEEIPTGAQPIDA